ncbi:hypothetical protein A8C32_11845 [Flavivirga aquatica]|uniref:Secretion system C-terminal sorting domain-containing protein n=1 Tax=Flavivirga aquatica TaxID=1849968 RepID=A0A1E5TDF1_9FLAO|nr:T9SS type A sorting domain-containing protein [Flavivirga aquatica]OEK09404.1 hypothetical protein A8C32_11845 [Flavivirga aquatica]
MKKITCLIYLFLVFNFSYGQTILAAGDIAITGFKSDVSNQFSFVLLTDIVTNTTINFTDNGWLSTNSFRAGEGTLTWTATSDLTCGTEIIITDNSPFSVSHGIVTDSASFVLEIDGDQILAYQGTDAMPTFIYAIDFDGGPNSWASNATSNNTSAEPLGLTNGTNAVSVQERDNGKYQCYISYEVAPILAAISDNSNWLINDDPDNVTLGLLCNYSCSPPILLSPGDLVVTGYNTDDTEVDAFTFVVLTDIAEGTNIGFTDKGWDTTTGAYRFGAGEGFLNWKVPAGGVPCGSEVIIFAASAGTGIKKYLSNYGTVTEPDEGFGFNASQDQLIAYSGSFGNPTNLYAIHYGGTGWNDATDVITSAVPVGLTDGTNAIYYGDFDSGVYDCSSVIGDALIAAEVADATNWSLIKNSGIQTLGTCNYSCCPATVWNGSVWSPIAVPDIDTTLIIDSDYTTGVEGDLEACSLIINAGNNLTVSNGGSVLIQNDVTVGGELTVESQGNFIQVGSFSSFVDNSSGGVTLTKSKSMYRELAYTYWGSPVVGEVIENTFTGVSGGRRFLFNAASFQDNLAETANTGVFTSGQDDIDDEGDDWQVASGVMQAGVGYATIARKSGSYPDTQDFVFTGAFNTGEVSVPLVNASGGAYNDWNFIANPYPGAIDVATFFSINSGIVGALYFWDQNTNENTSAPGNQSLNFSSDDYAMINGGGGVAASSGSTIPNGFVASGQGFFVEALSTGPVIFNNSMRVGTNNNSQFFKNTKSKKVLNNIDNKLWVNLSSDNGVFNQILLAYVNGATHQNDGAFYDAKRILTSGKAAILYSNIDNDNGKFAIQGRAVNNLNINEIINLGFKTNIEVATLYKLSIAQLQGGFLNDNVIYLKDNLLSLVHNLSDSDYTFTSETGEFNDRFQIVFNQNALSIYDALDINRNILKIIELENDSIQFKVSEDLTIKSIIIYDLLGKQLYNFKANKDAETYKLSNLGSGTYIAKVILSNEAIISKKMYKK